MSLPPWKLAEREEWAGARPLLAGLFFGLLMFPVYAVITGTEHLYLAALASLVSWPLFAVGVKDRWGQRPDANAQPRPTFRRMWSRMSDTWLSWFMWMGVAIIILTAFALLTGVVGIAAGLFRLIPTLYFTLSTWMERRRRRRPD